MKQRLHSSYEKEAERIRLMVADLVSDYPTKEIMTHVLFQKTGLKLLGKIKFSETLLDKVNQQAFVLLSKSYTSYLRKQEHRHA